MATEFERTFDAIWKMESGRVIASVAKLLRGDLGAAEEAAQEAALSAWEHWSREGLPENPGAWLMTTARRRGIDALRRRGTLVISAADPNVLEARSSAQADDMEEVDRILDDGIEDDLLRLIFATAHPRLGEEARGALTLRLVCGLTTEEIARAFLTQESTIAQRIVRAKKTLGELDEPFEIPAGEALRERLDSVLEVIYLLFNEGYSATSGGDWMRPALCDEAIRLGRILAARMKDEPEVHGLTALMELQASRMRARVDASGQPILLLDQDRGRWDQLLIRRGLAGLELASRSGDHPGPFELQAMIAACHATAATAEETNWERIATLYGVLSAMTGSPVVELNRAVAVAMARGPADGLAIIDVLAEDGRLGEYHPLHAARGDLLLRLERFSEAAAAFERAAQLAKNDRERALLEKRAQSCLPPAG
ncbi:MAG TPA: RNA polymerase sigma factor [Phycisphaerales bacterium]|nr:RNA polymerase sigma factor [Phycisphaerales bacterium]